MAVITPSKFSPALQPGAGILRRLKEHLVAIEVSEVILIVALVLGGAFLGLQLNRAQVALHTSAAALHTTQAKLGATAAQLKSTQADLSSSRDSLAAQGTVGAYSSTYISDGWAVDNARSHAYNACVGNNMPACKAAVAEWRAKLATLKTDIAAMAVPANLAQANQDLSQGIELMSTAVANLASAIDRDSGVDVTRAFGVIDQADSQLNKGESELLTALGGSRAAA